MDSERGITTHKRIERPIILDEEWIKEVCEGKGFFDWNQEAIKIGESVGEPTLDRLRHLQIRDESLRDGLGPCNNQPNFTDKLSYIQAVSDLGIEFVTLDIFSSNDSQNLSKNNKDTQALLIFMQQRLPRIKPVILARATPLDIEFLIKAHEMNPNLVGIIFQDLSEVRRRIQGWGTFEDVLGNLFRKVQEAKSAGISVMAFTENLSITDPDHVKLYTQAMCEAGADFIGIADTAGRLYPGGAAYLTRVVSETIERYRAEAGEERDIKIVFHGHDDLGNALNNSLAAAANGASVIDVVTNGIGERVGNTSLNLFLANVETRLKIIDGKRQNQVVRFDLRKLKSLSQMYERITGLAAGTYQAVSGERAFATNLGIHADFYLAVENWAAQMGDKGYTSEQIGIFCGEVWKLYSAISPGAVDQKPDIRISSLSGAANVILWLYYHGLINNVRQLPKDSPAVLEILQVAKTGWGELSDKLIRQIWENHD